MARVRSDGDKVFNGVRVGDGRGGTRKIESADSALLSP